MPPANKYNLPDEQQLLLFISQGDESAFTTLIAHYHNKVFSHALTFVKSYEMAEEITQDIFMKVWTNREKLPEVKNFKSYLFILGRNQLISAIRKHAAESTHDDIQDMPADTWCPDRQLEEKEMHRLVREGIEKLPPQQKAVFTLSRLEGLNHEEISKQLGISKHTVRWHMVLALNSLRKHVHNYLQLIPLLIPVLVMLLTIS